MHPSYNVPIIPQNLRKEETIVQIADTLKYLSEAAQDIFNRVNNRIELNNKQLLSLSQRIDTAHLKVAKLTGARKATQVFSSSKYPAVDVHRQYKSVFDDDNKIIFKRSKVKYKDIQIKDEPLETLQFYHVKVRDITNIEDTNGLGDVPLDVNSVNDLLLYNTGKNPYRHYVMSDPLQASLRMKKDESVDSSDIAAAPHSISDRATLTRSATESYFYSPDLGDVPTIDVPLDLPDLPGIADDLRYVNELGPGIAPSVTTTPNIPELPPLEEPTSIDANEADNSFLLPPPPPPPVHVEIPIEIIPEVPVMPVVTKPPEVAPIIKDVKSEPVVNNARADNSVAKLPVVVDDAHASLMEAIRKAGGSKNAKLRTAEPQKALPTGDLMADLHAKLSLRRKGISGTKNQDNPASFDTGSAMNKVSAMIPPPPIKTDQAESTNTEDEDWEE